MDYLLGIIIFLFGTIIGSFLNVVIFRFNTQKGLGGRSACANCNKVLEPHELIPVVSFVLQGGKCKKCKSKISLQYPIIELLSGLIFALLFLKLHYVFNISYSNFTFLLVYFAYLLSVLLVIAVYDTKHKIIPNSLSYVFSLVAFLGLFFVTPYGFSPHLPSLGQILSGPFLATPFILISLLSQGKWMGLGDGKLALGMGFMLGLSSGVAAMLLAFWSGAIVSIFVLLSRAKGYNMNSAIPFAPFMIFGLVVAFFFNIDLSVVAHWFLF